MEAATTTTTKNATASGAPEIVAEIFPELELFMEKMNEKIS